jgi:hypothetical protein
MGRLVTGSVDDPRAALPSSPEAKRRARQGFLNGEVHHWYRLVLGYSDRTVAFALDRLGVRAGDNVLDPFCGTGTTLVECMKRNISCVGIDANPSSCFAARVKTDWTLRPATLTAHLAELKTISQKHLRRLSSVHEDPTYRYIQDSGMLARGWISPIPLAKAVALKLAIRQIATGRRHRDALMLALIAEVVEGASNVKFGPELYCGPAKRDWDVFGMFASRVRAMGSDLKIAPATAAEAKVFQGDSRDLHTALRGYGRKKFGTVISSPPYPAEHDYTRNARLELAFLEEAHDRDSLQAIKREMIRCHTKGIYVNDSDDAHVSGFAAINSLANRIQRRTVGKTHKFAPLYPAVIRQYFGGMKRHLISLWPFLRPGALCAYVLGDQAGYLQVHIPTAELVAEVATAVGYKVVDIVCWREGRSLAASKPMHERILILRKPADGK